MQNLHSIDLQNILIKKNMELECMQIPWSVNALLIFILASK